MTQDEANKKMLSKVADVLYDSNNALNVWFAEYEDFDTDSDEYKKMDSARRWVGELLLRSWIELFKGGVYADKTG